METKFNKEIKTNRINKLKKFLDKNCFSTFGGKHKIQTFFSRNTAGDVLDAIYDEDGIQVDRCYYYDYIEIFGLNEKEKEEIRKYGYNEH